MRIVDLVKELIRLAGHTPEDIGITFSGLRPGEKLYEELLADADATLPTRFERLRIARLNDSADGVEELLVWARQASGAHEAEVRERVAAVVREYRAVGGH